MAKVKNIKVSHKLHAETRQFGTLQAEKDIQQSWVINLAKCLCLQPHISSS